METIKVSIAIPKEAVPYLANGQPEQEFARNAMILYPFIRNLTISRGRAAEILGVHKTDLIEFYNSMGIPCLDMSETELMADLAVLERVLGEKKCLMDEAAGRRVAVNMGLAITGSMGVLTDAFKRGALTREELKRAISDIRSSNRHISEELLKIVLDIAGE